MIFLIKANRLLLQYRKPVYGSLDESYHNYIIPGILAKYGGVIFIHYIYLCSWEKNDKNINLVFQYNVHDAICYIRIGLHH